MKFYRLSIFLTLCLLAVLPALRVSAHEGPHIRIAHLAPAIPAVDVYADGDLVVKALKFKDTSTYLALDGASIEFVITPAGGKIQDSLTEKPITLTFSANEGSFFTIALVASNKDKTLELVKLPADKGSEATDDHTDEPLGEVGTASAGNITVTGAYARPTVASASTSAQPATPDAMAGMSMDSGATSAAYMTIKNSSDKPDRLISIFSPAAVASLHQTIVKDGVAQMQPVDGIDIPANGTADLKPVGYHVMLANIRQGLVAGQTIALTLTFQSGTKVTVTAVIKM